jgi:hypothetical protein
MHFRIQGILMDKFDALTANTAWFAKSVRTAVLEYTDQKVHGHDLASWPTHQPGIDISWRKCQKVS